MVTFICHHCDTTLKKNQVERHSFGRCKPSAFICIDCHQTFYNNDYKTHISCLTEFEKHWGDYAKPKQITKPKVEVNVEVEKKTEVKAEVKAEVKEEVKEEVEVTGWRGWKNQIKSLLKENTTPIPLQTLKKQSLKRYRSFSHEEELDRQELSQLFNEKLKKLKGLRIVEYATLE